ncbi:hypothetical protein FD755_009435 [Muntiacus reevesi]|uniref:Large ribosomal subunit protein uL15m n=1 Tax=Muntiacus reevesi TaxID=9886 RepID=A0A5N3XWX9_MUNRE|nr:hypothetical protein FD755_009435 [Muntiacus reevesi]
MAGPVRGEGPGVRGPGPASGSASKLERRRRGQRRGRKCGRGHKGERQRGTRPRPGFEGGQSPFYLRIPKCGLNRLQYLIDLGRVDPTEPIDLTQLVSGRGGADTFKAKVNIEVQLASELAIASIERNGGVPIPKRMLPLPEALVPYYTDARDRGYLADPAGFPEARLELAKKYHCILPDTAKDQLFKMLSTRKDPRQIFFGLAPGWVVNMADRKILKPTQEKLLEYYRS